jgi:CheY-like chemotaxis protein
MKFLILDDVTTNCAILGRLARQAFEAETVRMTNPIDALALCCCERFDALIIDYFMPDMNGVEFSRFVRSLDGYRDTPIIMVTTADEQQIQSDAREVGVTDFMTKPVCMDQFRKRLGARHGADADSRRERAGTSGG